MIVWDIYISSATMSSVFVARQLSKEQSVQLVNRKLGYRIISNLAFINMINEKAKHPPNIFYDQGPNLQFVLESDMQILVCRCLSVISGLKTWPVRIGY